MTGLDKDRLATRIVSFKKALQKAIQDQCEQLEADTGLTPSGITFDLPEVTTKQDKLNRFGVGEVRVTFRP